MLKTLKRKSLNNKLKLQREKQDKCQHDFQPKFHSMSEAFAFFRCDKCGLISHSGY